MALLVIPPSATIHPLAWRTEKHVTTSDIATIAMLVSDRGDDVLVQPEQIGGVVVVLQFYEPSIGIRRV